MSIVNLSKRVTSKYDDYEKYSNSTDSLIYIDKPFSTDDKGPDCLSLTVGDCWYDKNRYVAIDKKRGLKIRPHAGIVIETNETIALPRNVYGILFGSGKNIYKGAFVSNGKIDPGFHGTLRIGYHNASNDSIVLKPGDKLAYAFFLTSENELPPHIIPSKSTTPDLVSPLNRMQRFWRWIKRNADKIITIALAIASLVVSIISLNP